ncbi:MAG: hypothetical protein AAF533_13010 [Acidobacteriota bacterium]
MSAITSRVLASLRRCALATAAIGLVVSALGCGGNDGGSPIPPSTQFAQSTVTLWLLDNTAVRGLQVNLPLVAGVTGISATQLGVLSGSLCEQNVGDGIVIACTSLPVFEVPAPIYELTILRDVTIDLDDATATLTCVGADIDGNTRPLACELR